MIAVPLGWHAIGYLLFGAVACAVIFLSIMSFSRVETVNGQIALDSGVATAVATRSGVVADIAVREGQLVALGTQLATIRAEEDGLDAQAPGELIEAAIARQDTTLRIQIDASVASAEAQQSRLSAERVGLSAEIDQLELQREAQGRLIETAREDFQNANEIAARGFLSKRDLRLREETLLSRQQAIAQLDQALAVKRAALAESIRSSAQIAAQARVQSAMLEGDRAQVAQQAANAAAVRAYVLRSPVAGRITALTARIGQPVSPGAQLMSIVPAKAQLTAQLAVQSAAIGFVKPGQEVRLALDAFPYQRFGTLKGTVRIVPISPVDAFGADGTKIAIFPVIVELHEHHITAFGRSEQLVPGMRLTARIITERQSLLEWLFEPLFAVRKR